MAAITSVERELRFVTHLSPGIPTAFFEAVVDHVGRALGRRVSLSVESRVSGPERGAEDPFSKGEADVGFMCAPSFFWLRETEEPPVELLGAAPVFEDMRASGRPVYFSEVIVRRESRLRSFVELRGCSWAYNDPCSLSGYFNTLKRLKEMGEDERFFGRMHCSGSHLNSIEMVACGEVDAAAIDSNVLRIQLGIFPKLRDRVRVIETWGPFPIQPVVVRSGLHRELKDRLREGFLTMDSPALARFGLERFVPVTRDHYAPEERALSGCTGVDG
ncbi:MAG: PhnD/SsuA/transferrin family substrate-binding protein [Rubrobacteraceae bacterium]